MSEKIFGMWSAHVYSGLDFYCADCAAKAESRHSLFQAALYCPLLAELLFHNDLYFPDPIYPQTVVSAAAPVPA